MRRPRLSRLLIFVMFTVILAILVITTSHPGIKFATPEEAVLNYWDSLNKQDMERASLSFSGVRMIDAPLVAQNMWTLSVQVNGLEILEKTVLDERNVHLKYTVFLKRGRYVTGDLLSYNAWFGWRITGPTSEAPK